MHYYPVLSSERAPCGALEDNYGVTVSLVTCDSRMSAHRAHARLADFTALACTPYTQNPQLLHLPEYYDQCTARNISSYDAASIYECSSARTLSPQAVPIPQVRALLLLQCRTRAHAYLQELIVSQSFPMPLSPTASAVSPGVVRRDRHYFSIFPAQSRVGRHRQCDRRDSEHPAVPRDPVATLS